MTLSSTSRRTSPEISADSVLASLAIIKVNFDDTGDYISNFIPLVAQALKEASAEEVSLHEVQAGVRETFGLDIPQGALSTILHRAARNRLVVRSNGIYRRNRNALDKLDFALVRGRMSREANALLTKLSEFARERYGLEWSRADAEAALLSYLEGRQTSILAFVHAGSPLPRSAPVDHAGVVVKSFVLELAERDPGGFEFLVSVVKGTMLTNVLYLPDGPASAGRRFGTTEFFFDTAFLLRATGFASTELRAPCLELVELLRDQDAAMRVFRHTVDEMHAAIDHCVRALPSCGRIPLKPPAQFLIDDGWSVSDVERFAADLSSALARLGVQIVERPDHSERLGLDEESLAAQLKQAMPSQTKDALRRDIDSLTSIHRLRHGRPFSRLEDCRAMFVTTNGALNRVATDYFRTAGGGEAGIPPCIHAHALAMLAWLKRPTQAPNLPRMELIADSYAALNPSDELWARYTREIERLEQRGDVSTAEFHMLRYSMEARRELMTVTYGDHEVFTEGSVAAILDRARAHTRAEVQAELELEREARARDADSAAKALAEQHTAGEAAEIALQQAARDAADAREDARRARAVHDAALDRAATVVARWMTGAVLLAVAAVVLVGTIAATGAVLPERWQGELPVVLIPFVIGSLCFGALNLLFGVSLRSVADRLRPRIAKGVRRVLDHLTGQGDLGR